MKKMRIVLALLLVALLLTGCAKSAQNGGYDSVVENAPAGSSGIYDAAGESGSGGTTETARKLIRTITMDAETSDMDTLLREIDAKLSELGGYVQEKSVRNGNGGTTRSATMTLRIPADRLDSFVAHVEGASNILSSTEKAEDVTLQYSATLSRITALETEEARLLELLAEAGNLNELLLLESKLADVREELETVRSQLKLYDSLIDYGTVKLTITEVKEYTVVEEEEPTAWERMGTGFIQSVKSVWNILTEWFIFLVAALPYLVIPGVLVLVIVLSSRKKRKKKEKHPPENPG